MLRYMLIYEAPAGEAGSFFIGTYDYAEYIENNLTGAGFHCELYERIENESGIGLEYRCIYK